MPFVDTPTRRRLIVWSRFSTRRDFALSHRIYAALGTRFRRNAASRLPPISTLDGLPSMLHREHVCVEVRNPLLALLRDSKIAQGINGIRLNRPPKKLRIICPQIRRTIVVQLLAHPRLAELVKRGCPGRC